MEALPDDIEAVWGGGKKDGTGELAIKTASFLIDEWGLERFRRSELHQQAMRKGKSRREPVSPDPRYPEKGR